MWMAKDLSESYSLNAESDYSKGWDRVYPPYWLGEGMWAMEKARVCPGVPLSSVAGFLCISGPGFVKGKAGRGKQKASILCWA